MEEPKIGRIECPRKREIQYSEDSCNRTNISYTNSLLVKLISTASYRSIPSWLVDDKHGYD